MLKCSIIIPNYNHAKYLEQRITSVLNQTFKEFELIILDDFSTDESASIIEKYRHHPKVSKILVNEENSGSPFKQWAKGAAIAKAEWVWFAESDDFAEPDFLETAFNKINNCEESGLFYSDSTYNSDKGTPYRFNNSAAFKNDYFHTTKWSADYCIQGIDELNSNLKFLCTIINASCTLYRKEYIIEVTKELMNFRYYGDWYCQIKIALTSKICYSSKQLNSCRMHADNFLNNLDKTKSKEEYFRILNLLINNDTIRNKSTLISFFTIQYLGFGLIKDGLFHGFKIFKKYFTINPYLASKILSYLFFQKITFKKRKTIY